MLVGLSVCEKPLSLAICSMGFVLLWLRCEEEDVDMAEDAKELLTRIARDTSLRYAMHMIMASALVCQKRKGSEVEVQDLKKVLPIYHLCMSVSVSVCRL